MSASPSWYRMALVLALIAALSQVALGGVVRVTGSGDACPDWPLCHGQIIPPLDLGVWLEFGHRLSASVLGVLVLQARGLAWRKDPADRVSVGGVNAALALVVVASLLGGVTALTELAWWARLIHLVLAELVVACLAVAWLAGPGGAPQATDPARAGAQSLNRTVGLATLGMMLGAILFGSYMVGFNYGAACTSWPMCQGIRIPEGTAYLVNMGHRVTTIAIAAPLIWLCWRAWRAGTGAPRVLVCSPCGRLPGRRRPPRGPGDLGQLLGADAVPSPDGCDAAVGLDRRVGGGAVGSIPVPAALEFRVTGAGMLDPIG